MDNTAYAKIWDMVCLIVSCFLTLQGIVWRSHDSWRAAVWVMEGTCRSMAHPFGFRNSKSFLVKPVLDLPVCPCIVCKVFFQHSLLPEALEEGMCSMPSSQHRQACLMSMGSKQGCFMTEERHCYLHTRRHLWSASKGATWLRCVDWWGRNLAAIKNIDRFIILVQELIRIAIYVRLGGVILLEDSLETVDQLH